MPLKKGYTPEVVSHNIKEMVKAGYKPKQAIGASLAQARKFKKMALGGVVSPSDDLGFGTGQTVGDIIGYPGSKKKKMSDGGLVDDEDYQDDDDSMRSLGELQKDGEYYPDEVAHPAKQQESQPGDVALALKRQALSEEEKQAIEAKKKARRFV